MTLRVARGSLLPSTSRLPVDLDWKRIASYLSQHGHVIDLSFTPRRFAGGLANINILLRANNDWVVFRRPPAGPLPKGAHDMAREHRVLSVLWQALPIAPRSLHFCDDAAVAGAPFQIIAYQDGRVVRGDSMFPLPDEEDAGQALSRMLVETLGCIHSVDTTAVGLSDLGRPEGFIPRTIAGWAARAGAVLGTRMSASCRFLIGWLETQKVADTIKPALIHNDFKLDNIVLRYDAIAPAAVLDWDMATRGDPLFDLATMLSYWAEEDDPPCMHRLAQMPTARPGFFTREAVARQYAELTGHDLSGFVVHRVLAVFKLATVFHQLHQRYLSSEVTDSRFASFGDLADEIFDFAVQLAREKLF